MKTIQQQVAFNEAPAELYELYMDAKLHTKATGAKASISKKIGSKFSAWDGYISGRTLHLVPGEMIVQTWRAKDWKKSVPDSIIVLSFLEDEEGGTDVELVHANVPDAEYRSLMDGWHEFYWRPWEAFLAERTRPAAAKKAKKARR